MFNAQYGGRLLHHTIVRLLSRGTLIGGLTLIRIAHAYALDLVKVVLDRDSKVWLRRRNRGKHNAMQLWRTYLVHTTLGSSNKTSNHDHYCETCSRAILEDGDVGIAYWRV